MQLHIYAYTAACLCVAVITSIGFSLPEQEPEAKSEPHFSGYPTPVHECTTTTPVISEGLPETPRKTQMKKMIGKLRTKLWRSKVKKATAMASKALDMALLHSLIEKLLSTQTATFINSQFKIHCKASKKGYKCLQDKLFALSVFYHSRKVYILVQKLFILSSKTTVLIVLQKTDIYLQLSNQVFNALQRKVAGFICSCRYNRPWNLSNS